MGQKAISLGYWVLTGLFCVGMLFSGISELMGVPSANEALIQLGYPLYLNSILGTAKVLGVIALLQPRWKTLKEWAYAGFTIDILGAAASIALNGNGIIPVLTTLPFLILLFGSYLLGKKRK